MGPDRGPGGSCPAREGALLNGGAAYYRIYRTGDGKFVALGAIEKAFWRNFCEAMARRDWTDRHADPLPQTVLIAEVADVFAGAPRVEWDRRLKSVDCCYQPVLDYGEVPAHPHVAARGLVRGAEAAFAAIVDGEPPSMRAPHRDITIEEAVAAWVETV